MSIPVASIGTKVSYAFETVAGERPTSGYKVFPQFTATPDLNTTPDTAETTSFDNQTYTSKRAMLKDLDVLEFTARLTEELYDLYMGTNGLMETYEDKKASNLGMWLCIDLKELNKAFYLPVEPVTMGLPAIDTNVVIDITLYFSAVADPVWGDKPAYYTETVSTVTVSGVTADDVVYAILGNTIRAQKTATTTSVVFVLPYETSTVYTIASSAGKAATATVASATTSVSLS